MRSNLLVGRLIEVDIEINTEVDTEANTEINTEINTGFGYTSSVSGLRASPPSDSINRRDPLESKRRAARPGDAISD
jgi:hypothetical protein